MSKKRVVCLNNGKRDAVDLLVDVERIDVGHAADVVEHGHDAGFQLVAVDVVLTAEAPYELLRMIFEWIHGSIHQVFHQRFHDAVTTQLYV